MGLANERGALLNHEDSVLKTTKELLKLSTFILETGESFLSLRLASSETVIQEHRRDATTLAGDLLKLCGTLTTSHRVIISLISST